MSKNILIFSTAYFPLVGGAEVAAKEITQRLPDWQFDLITARIKSGLKKFERISNINVYRVGLGLESLDKFLLPITGYLKAKQLNKKNNYQIIWSIMASQAGVAAAFFKIFHSQKKLVLTLQEGDKEEHLKRYVFGLGFLYKFLIRPWHLLPFRNADIITVISSDLKKRALENGIKVPVKIIPNAVDLEIFRPKEKAAVSGPKIILTVSRLVKKNGIDDLIKAGQYLNFDFKILIIGVGPDESKLKKLTKKLNLENRVEFLGQIEYSNLPDYYHRADVFVRPSLSEGLGNVFLEAMACGTPIVGTPVGGIPDFLIERETGLFCQAGNPKSVAQKIEEILASESLRENLIKNGLEIVRERYNWDNIARQMEGVYDKLYC